MKHAKTVLAVDLVQIAILQGLVNERVNKIDANKREFATKVIEREGAIEAALLKLRDTLCRVTARQFLA
ncbi:MAG: hypothetical protein AABM33_15955 [Pseudomonadota bacterium]